MPKGPSVEVVVSNRQRTRPVRSAAIRALAESVAQRQGVGLELGIHLVSPKEMARVNWQFLQHEGSTDVITFDHGSRADHLHGELFISVHDAVLQAAEFGTEWRQELLRYVIHGILHLQGFDDLDPVSRKLMKRHEERLVRAESDRAVELERVPKKVHSRRKPRGAK